MSGRFAELPERPKLVICAHDTKFTRDFQKIVESDGVELKRVGPLAPNLNAYAERWVQSIQQECLDRFVVFGEDHPRNIVREYLACYNDGERPTRASGTCRSRSGPTCHRATDRFGAASGWAGCSSTTIARRRDQYQRIARRLGRTLRLGYAPILLFRADSPRRHLAGDRNSNRST